MTNHQYPEQQSAENDVGLDIETAASLIASLRARLDAVSDLADHLVGNEAAPLLREALNGHTPTERRTAKCEGLAPFNCGNPTCPAHVIPPVEWECRTCLALEGSPCICPIPPAETSSQ